MLTNFLKLPILWFQNQDDAFEFIPESALTTPSSEEMPSTKSKRSSLFKSGSLLGLNRSPSSSSSEGSRSGSGDSKTWRNSRTLFANLLPMKSPKLPSIETSSETETRTETPTPSRLSQFKAWTLDRKLLRSKWRKTASQLDLISPTEAPKRSSLFDSTLLKPEEIRPRTKTAPQCDLSAVTDITTPKQGDLQNLIRQKRNRNFGFSMTSERRREWLESHLKSEESPNGGVDLLSPTTPLTPTSNEVECPTDHQLLQIRLTKDDDGELGVYITNSHDGGDECRYVIAGLHKGSAADRTGLLRKHDELIKVNNRKVRGLHAEEAHMILSTDDKVVDLVVARKVSVHSIESSILYRSVVIHRHWCPFSCRWGGL